LMQFPKYNLTKPPAYHWESLFWGQPSLSSLHFPALVAVLIHLRSMVVSHLFSFAYLQYLGPATKSEEDYIEE
jgi:hypothetical protein